MLQEQMQKPDPMSSQGIYFHFWLTIFPSCSLDNVQIVYVLPLSTVKCSPRLCRISFHHLPEVKICHLHMAPPHKILLFLQTLSITSCPDLHFFSFFFHFWLHSVFDVYKSKLSGSVVPPSSSRSDNRYINYCVCRKPFGKNMMK